VISYIVRRILTSIPVLIGVVSIAFITAQFVPGDPLARLLPEDPTPEQYAALAKELGVDRPLIVQWGTALLSTFTWDFGRSISTRQPIRKELPLYFRGTGELAALAFVIAVLLAVPAGITAAVRQDSLVDHVLRVVTLGGVAAPLFWTALMLQFLFYGYLGWLPAGGQMSDYVNLTSPLMRVTGFGLFDAILTRNWIALRDLIMHMALPVAVLAYRVVAIIARMTRATVIEILQQDFVRTARSAGLHERRILFRHVLKNAAPAILTILGLSFGQLLQGSILVEAVFNWPGMGLYAVRAITNLDYPVIVAVSVVICFVYMGVNLLVDLLYPILDPRIQYA
jgi:peptide/nickel transport system permease protein